MTNVMTRAQSSEIMRINMHNVKGYKRTKDKKGGEARRSAEHAVVVVRRPRRRSVRRRQLGVPCDTEALCGRNVLVIESVLHATVEDTNTHHGQQLCEEQGE